MYKRMNFIILSIILISLSVIFVIRCYADGGDEKSEAVALVQQTSAHWAAHEYQQAKDLIDAKLAEKPGWIPAVLLKSAYCRHIEVDRSATLATLATIDSAVSALNSVQYEGFIALYNWYKIGIQQDPSNFSEPEKNARRELAHDLFQYFPGSELVALYFYGPFE